MNIAEEGVGLAIVLFGSTLVALDVGRRLGLRRLSRDADDPRTGTGAVEGAVFALLGLLIAFTFSGAAGRFDTRRQLVADEANAVGTALLRLDLLPADGQPALRTLFREYLDTRIEVHHALPDLHAADRLQGHAEQLQAEIWALGRAAVEKDGRPFVASLVLQSLNDMFDISDARMAAAHMHVPGLILAMLLVLEVLAALLAGHAMATPKGRSWLHMLAFAGIMALTIYVIIDMEHPRAGLIRMDAADRPLLALRDAMDDAEH